MLSLRHLAQSDRFADVVRVFLALTGIATWCTLAGPTDTMVPALLGAIACALAETDDAWRGRLRGLVVTLICFAAAAAAVKASIGIVPLFVVLLPAGTFMLVMLGAASGRYATIATATLILSVYTMIASDASTAAPSDWRGTVAILAGAAWYGVLSLLWSALAPQLCRGCQAADAGRARKAELRADAHLLYLQGGTPDPDHDHRRRLS